MKSKIFFIRPFQTVCFFPRINKSNSCLNHLRWLLISCIGLLGQHAALCPSIDRKLDWKPPIEGQSYKIWGLVMELPPATTPLRSLHDGWKEKMEKKKIFSFPNFLRRKLWGKMVQNTTPLRGSVARFRGTPNTGPYERWFKIIKTSFHRN